MKTEERICDHCTCSTGMLKDEIHFLFVELFMKQTTKHCLHW